ncbi:MAG: pyridoxamine 5'-phosphate oxidase [Gammaproteobacteria bacterium]|nr:MAG: pyridoxamine 5'-phosphate oxidase [Gammaproteobacteria bacterium]
MSGLHEEVLPEILPSSPMQMADEWFCLANRKRLQPNPDAMVIASAATDGHPSARVVLCKKFVPDPGYLVFFTNYESRKAAELEERPEVAAVFHWDTLRRQMRIEGHVVRSPADESDKYFASRSWKSRIGAWASRQSQAVVDRPVLLEQVSKMATRFGACFRDGRFAEMDIPPVVARPPFWGGYRLWISRLELWVEGEGRVHDRALWKRRLAPHTDGTVATGPWTATRLQP